MFFSIIPVAALMASTVLSAPISSINPAAIIKRGGSGTARIHNNCAFSIVANPCYNGNSDPDSTIEPNSTWTHELMSWGGAGQGVSIKLSSNEESAPSGVAQLEYTVNDLMAITFYDLSLIDGNPFGAYDQKVVNTGGNIWCGAGVADCKAAYMTPTDNWANHGTAAGTDLDFYLCGGAPADEETS